MKDAAHSRTSGRTGHIARLLSAAIERARDELDLRRANEALSQVQSLGQCVVTRGKLVITDPKSVAIGHHVHIGKNAHFESEGGLAIGDHVALGRDVTISTISLCPPMAGRLPPSGGTPCQVTIEREVRIGSNVFIGAGARIGAGAVVESGCVVCGEVPAGALVRPAPPQFTPSGALPPAVPGACVRSVVSEVSSAAAAKAADWVHGNHPKANLFFVVTTGRSGSVTISEVLSQNSRIQCYHELRPQMIRLSTELAHGLKTEEEAKRELSDVFLTGSLFPVGKVHGESDQKYWNLIPLLMKTIPSAKFIWLIRDGRDVVASTFGQEWFPSKGRTGNSVGQDLYDRWLYYRLDGAICGAFSADDWEKLSLFEKNCWHWSYVNAEIERRLGEIPQERWTTVQLEELEQKTDALFQFLGVEAAPVRVERRNQAPYSVKRWEKWGDVEKAAFVKWCGAEMDRWYPGWRRGEGLWQRGSGSASACAGNRR